MSTAGVDYEAVANQVRVLRILVDEFLDDVHPALLSTRNVQDSSRWTDLPECAGFRSQYKAAIDTADIRLREVWEDIKTLALNVQAAAAALSAVDQTISDDLAAILARIDTETPTAYSGTGGGGVPLEILNRTDGYLPGSGIPATESSSVTSTAQSGA